MISRRRLLQYSAGGFASSVLPMPSMAQTPRSVCTRRIVQMTGKFDPDGLVHFQDTSVLGVDGVDLGASTVHKGKTFIFFGDVPRVGRNSGPVQDADAIGIIDDIQVPQRAQLAAGKQSADQSDAFFIGENGALYVAWVVGGDTWNHPFQISAPGLAPVGACLAAAKQFDQQLNVFFIGRDGGLYVTWVVDLGIWQGPQLISQTGIAKPGGKLVAIKQFDNQLNVFFIGSNRRLHVAWSVNGGAWQGPQVVGRADIPYPQAGAGIAACKQGANQLDVFFIGDDGGFYVAWSTAGGVWQGPQKVSPANLRVSIPGANLATFNQTSNQVTVVFVDSAGRLSSMWVVGGGVWQGPAPAVPGLHPAKPGTQVVLAMQGPNQWDAFLVNQDGAVQVYWVVGLEAWQGPVEIAGSGSTFDDGTLAVVQQLDDQITVIFAGTVGDLQVNWVKGLGTWQGPVRVNPEMLGMRLVRDGQYFHPYTIRGTETDPTKIWITGTNETPTGAFSYGERVYVFAVAGREKSASYLTSSASPDSTEPFQFHFAFSRGPDENSGRFLQVAPVVVNTREIPGLSSDASEGVILFGHGRMQPNTPVRPGCIDPRGPSGVQLAFMPIHPEQGPTKSGTLYYAGGPQRWTTNEAAAKTLFTTCYYWTSVSAGRIPGAGKWILLYQLSGPAEVSSAHDLPIVARIADTPWDIATAPDIPIFSPVLDNAWDHFMFKPSVPDSNRNLPHIGHPAFAYGAFLLHKYTQWDESHRFATIFYLMSTGRPYQVQLMSSVIAL